MPIRPPRQSEYAIRAADGRVPFVIPANTEHSGVHSSKVIFAIAVPPVPVVVRSDITKNDDHVRSCELIVLGKSCVLLLYREYRRCNRSCLFILSGLIESIALVE